MATINGMAIPHATYPASTASYWTSDKTAKGATLSANNATECMGFSNFIYYYLYGSYTAGTAITKRTCAGTSADFSNINIGARINCTGPYGNHSMIVLDKTSTGVTMYDANWKNYGTEQNRVDQRTYTWVSFKSTFSSINSGYTK